MPKRSTKTSRRRTGVGKDGPTDGNNVAADPVNLHATPSVCRLADDYRRLTADSRRLGKQQYAIDTEREKIRMGLSVRRLINSTDGTTADST